MRNRSNDALGGRLAPIEVDPDFPVGEPIFNTRGENPEIGMHIHNLFEIGFCFDGSGVFLIGSKVFAFRRGDAVVISSREFHLARANPGATASWGFLNFDPAALLPAEAFAQKHALDPSRCGGENFRNLVDRETEPELAETIRQLIVERSEERSGWKPMLRALTWRMLILLARSRDLDGEERGGTYRDLERIAPALKLIGENFGRRITEAEMARCCFTSIPNFRKLFGRATGSAPRPYLLDMRLRIAAEMLKDRTTPIGEIAARCGYRTLSNFNRQFRSRYGRSPRRCREELSDRSAPEKG